MSSTDSTLSPSSSFKTINTLPLGLPTTAQTAIAQTAIAQAALAQAAEDQKISKSLLSKRKNSIATSDFNTITNLSTFFIDGLSTSSPTDTSPAKKAKLGEKNADIKGQSENITATISTPATPPTSAITPVTATTPATVAMGSAGGKPKVMKTARPATDRKHTTELYIRYDPWIHVNLNIPTFKTRGFSYDLFNDCPLFMDLTPSNDDGTWDPPDGVRLDDYNCGEALLRLDAEILSTRYPTEFDSKGMLRAIRNPLGYARKIFVIPGMVDSNGNVASSNDTGYYYIWFKGLQPLIGKEGFDAGLFTIRPSNEKLKT
jgi:hypothetical protein